MAAANVARINHADPGPSDTMLLTQQPNHRSEVIWNGQDPGTLTCRSRSSEFSNREPMVDDRVVNIMKALGLEGLLWIPGREIDNGLITALVERWRPETHTFHMPHGEISITLQDVEVLLGLPVDGDAITGSTQKTWPVVCREFLGFAPINQDQHKQLDGQRILISRLLEQVAGPLSANAEEDDVHKYARCYILALLGDTIFADKSGDRVHLMWVQQLEDLRNPHMYSWGSACLAWLYRELCKASDRGTSQIGGVLLLVQYWAWARFPYLCPAVERGPPVGAYGPPVRAPLALKWLWVPNKKNRPAHIFRDRYREQLASMLPSQVVWQPYEAEFDHLPPWCVAGRAVWTAKVPLVCFHLIEKHTPERVVRQFGMIQGIPPSIDTDTVLHKIDLRGKVGVDWMRRHAVHIVHWRNRLQRRFEVVLGEMPPQHEYFGWFDRVTRRFIDRPGAKLTMLVSLVNRLSRHHPVGTEEHEDITDVLTAVHRIDRVQPPIPEAPNEDAATPAGPSSTEGPSTSTTSTGCPSRPPVATPQVIPTPDSSPYTPHASPSLTIPAFTSHPSPSLTIPAFTSHPSPRFPYTPHASPSLTIPAFTSHPSPRFTISAFTSHPSPTFTIPSSTPHPSPSPTIPHPAPRPTIPPPTPHPCHGSDIRPPLPQSFPELSPIPSFHLGFHPTPPEMQQEPPSHSTSIAPSLAIDPPHIQAE
ncbi:serine/threonine-protein phosphatase 7 long form homolog [Quercus suber]|uniref:serine/threonine-protein phosphatase 7 long form homolog n=1 Tax=Quercus suber TaxID=58331 RepID=UPI0032DF3224